MTAQHLDIAGEPVETWAGYREHRVNKPATRAAGVTRYVVIVEAEPAGLDPDGGRWVTVCDAHSNLVNHDTRRLARDHATYPEGWCEECRGGAE